MPTPVNENELEAKIQTLGSDIFKELDSESSNILSAAFYSDLAMQWAMKDEDFKISLFRFVDVLPTLNSSSAVMRHIKEYFTPVRNAIPAFLRPGLLVPPSSALSALVSKIVAFQVQMIAKQLILGTDSKSALSNLRAIRKKGVAFTVDILGEAAVSEEESREYLEKYLEILDTLSREMPRWKESKPLIEGHRGESTPINISVKLSALFSQTKPLAHEYSVSKFSERLFTILERAQKVNASVYVDMEDCALTSIIIDAFKKTLEHPQFKNSNQFGIVLQAYLRRTHDDVVSIIDWAKKQNLVIPIRLVKGAYWDTESISGKQQHWPIPVWQVKACSDANYEALSRILLENHQHVHPAFASHNIRSLTHAICYAKEIGVSETQYELQTLHGMAESIVKAYTKRGYLVREYSPVGELIPGMGYLVRRLLENTSNEGFLRLSKDKKTDTKALLKKPHFDPTDTGEEHLLKSIEKEFYNIPLTDYTLKESRDAIKKALSEEQAKREPRVITPLIHGITQPSNETIVSICPEETNWVYSKTHIVKKDQINEIVQSLHSYSSIWKQTSVEKRANILFSAAKILLKRRTQLTAIIVLESGKPVSEADADVAEAIDFLNYYAHEALKMFSKRRMGELPGELNYYFYEPRGVCAVISPWNFPLAIPCGMLSAALVTGNCAVLKPSEQSNVIAFELSKALFDAGLPKEALAFVPGIGEEVGPALVTHPLVSTIAFTGSKQVGLEIINSAANTSSSAVHVKRVIAEMGGKNAIIVDDDADLDEAVKGVLYSAFGFAGQKCSACSRVIVLEGNYDKFVSRLSEAVKSIRLGRASSEESFLGPVIDRTSFERINSIIAECKKSCTLLAEALLPNDLPHGNYVPPVVFGNIPDGHLLHTQEIFGPVLAVFKVSSFEKAIELALSTEYSLTGGLYSRSPERIEKACLEFNVGNLYINRPCTGALVMRQPFGGSKMSGVGSKAGGPDYLHQFVIPRSISENTIRRGFAPDNSETSKK